MMRHIFRGRVLHCLDKPGDSPDAVEYIEDAGLIVEAGRVIELQPYEVLERQGLSGAAVEHLGRKLIVPGFIDTHVHAPQLDVIASYGAQLLEWLENYTFPAEMRFDDPEYAKAGMRLFIDEKLAAGSTTAMVFSTSHELATNLLFERANELSLRLIAGKVLMDRNAPEALCDTPELGYQQSSRLIERWHDTGRLSYAVTPRFSITSTPEQLELAGQLVRENPDVYVQTHLSENPSEIAAVKKLFPDAANYLDTYDRYGLCTSKTMLAHCIHLEDSEINRISEAGAKVAFCPSSNLFLGSGLFDWQKLENASISISLASDVGGGTSLSMLNTLSEAYRVCQLRGMSLSPMMGFYSITLGNARALGLEAQVGNLVPGSEADFLVLDPDVMGEAGPARNADFSIEQEWFKYMMLGDHRLVSEVWVNGAEYQPIGISTNRNEHLRAI